MHFKSPLGKLFQLDSALLFGFLFHGLARFYDDSELDYFGPLCKKNRAVN